MNNLSYKHGFQAGLRAMNDFIDREEDPPFPPPLEEYPVPKNEDPSSWKDGWCNGWLWFADYSYLL